MSWGALSRWYDDVGPELAIVSLLAAIAVVLAGWLVLAAALQVLASRPALHLLRPVADRISPRSLQRLGHSLAGLSLTAGLAAPVGGAGIPPGSWSAATTVLATDEEPPPTVDGDGAAGTATMRLVDDGRPSPAAEEPARDEVTLVPGDSFWSVAVAELTDARGRAPRDRDVVPYWRQLIDANRPILVDPANPDLLYPGQVVVLPPL